jgi:hypothetical protein
MGHHSDWLIRAFALHMKRYFLKTKAANMYDGPDAENYLATTIYQIEPKAIRTGILDAKGNDIYMIDEPEPIGFIKWRES